MATDSTSLVELGHSGVKVSPMGVGTMLWKNGSPTDESVIRDAYRTAIDGGLTLFDTAEIYSRGESEAQLAACRDRVGGEVAIASKFAPPSRMIPMSAKRESVPADSPRALMEALNGSLRRLRVDHLDLYQLHAPPSKNSIGDYMHVMADAVDAGKIRAVGVCNFSASQIREAHDALSTRGIPLATAMVGYNLLRRWPESNGVFDICRELDISVIPYGPLAEGVLTGKYRQGARVPLSYAVTLYFGHLDITKERPHPTTLLGRIFSRPRELSRLGLEPLFDVMDAIAKEHDRSLAQVAINWLIGNQLGHVVPIPGMRDPHQVTDNLGAVDWAMSAEERLALEEAEEMTRR